MASGKIGTLAYVLCMLTCNLSICQYEFFFKLVFRPWSELLWSCLCPKLLFFVTSFLIVSFIIGEMFKKTNLTYQEEPMIYCSSMDINDMICRPNFLMATWVSCTWVCRPTKLILIHIIIVVQPLLIASRILL